MKTKYFKMKLFLLMYIKAYSQIKKQHYENHVDLGLRYFKEQKLCIIDSELKLSSISFLM